MEAIASYLVYFCFRLTKQQWAAEEEESHRYVVSRLPLILSGVFYCSGPGDLKLEPRYGCNSNGSFHETNFSYLPFYHNSSIINCSNGLLLFYRSIPSAFHVCNPTTKTWASLPKPRGKSQLSILAFDAYKSPYYKVVCFSGWEAQGGQLEVFSSLVEHSLNWGVDTNNLSALMNYFNGVLYVLTLPGHVACIDLEKMRCSVIELPENMKNDSSLGNSGGFLHCAVSDAIELRIWVLKGMKWVLKNREDVVFLWVMGKLMFYDLCKKRFDLVCELGTEKERVQFVATKGEIILCGHRSLLYVRMPRYRAAVSSRDTVKG
ncbi:uncharacterized protein LOC110110277 [Dendrobium catenatum]|uniref:uncharacterized protein LOC110110277 n=1 Tax=Dendrobium catenatum TaxID=906689 RepID=UPI0009F514DD|nr:uncharacterized protein LOC110110277 [Dendrobium catenatum]